MSLNGLAGGVCRDGWRVLRIELGIVGWSLITCALLVLGGVAHMFWAEWVVAQEAMSQAEMAKPRGFIGIGAGAAAQPPADYVRYHDGKTFLWANPYRSQRAWYDVTGCLLPPEHFNFELGIYDGIQSPIQVENTHAIARRLSNYDAVIGVALENEACAFPDMIMRKVMLVNDELAGHAIAVLYLPPRMGDSVAVYQRDVLDPPPVLELTGYLYAHQPVLFDKQTGSLWHASFGESELIAVSGPLQGHHLPLIGTAERTSWRDWYRHHRTTQVLIGADRGTRTSTGRLGRTPTLTANVAPRARW